MECLENITVYAVADDTYTAYINGIEVLSGNDWHHSNHVELKPETVNLKIGEPNILHIKATNWHHGSPACLSYQVTASGNQQCP